MSRYNLYLGNKIFLVLCSCELLFKKLCYIIYRKHPVDETKNIISFLTSAINFQPFYRNLFHLTFIKYHSISFQFILKFYRTRKFKSQFILFVSQIHLIYHGRYSVNIPRKNQQIRNLQKQLNTPTAQFVVYSNETLSHLLVGFFNPQETQRFTDI